MTAGIDIIAKAFPDFNTCQTQKDYLSLLHKLPNETLIAARSALRLGKPDSLASTHLFLLRFTYESHEATYRKRMQFVGGEVIAYADELERIDQGEKENLLRARSQTELGSFIPGTQKSAATMQFVAVVQVNFPVERMWMTHQLGKFASGKIRRASAEIGRWTRRRADPYSRQQRYLSAFTRSRPTSSASSKTQSSIPTGKLFSAEFGKFPRRSNCTLSLASTFWRARIPRRVRKSSSSLRRGRKASCWRSVSR